MSSRPHTDDVYVSKRKPKSPINFKIQLNSEQKEAKDLILRSPISVIDGGAGVGKTTIASNIALDLLFNKEIKKIIIARPFVTAGEDIGFLPGGVDQKLEYLTFPIYEIMKDLTGSEEKVKKLVSEDQIKVIPIGFLRGVTFNDSLIIIDEAQNLTKLQTELILGRLGKNGKLLFCGDKTQCDLKNKLDSGMLLLNDLSKNIEGVSYIKLLKNHRHELVGDILDYIKNNGI